MTPKESVDCYAGCESPRPGQTQDPHGSGLGVFRWVVERTISWLHSWGRLRRRLQPPHRTTPGLPPTRRHHDLLEVPQQLNSFLPVALKTHPFDGYWGCAIVLTTRGRKERFDPMCHIGITTAVFTHDYQFGELDTSRLEILTSDVQIRAGPHQHIHGPQETCIGIYASKVNSYVNVIGRTEALCVYPHRLTYRVGDGANGGWPFCGPVRASLGYEAVHEWRSVHDWASAGRRFIAAAEKSTEEMFELRPGAGPVTYSLLGHARSHRHASDPSVLFC